jgi:hypothetical protein
MMSKSTKATKPAEANAYVGSSVDEFFAADGLLEEIEAAALLVRRLHLSLETASASASA